MSYLGTPEDDADLIFNEDDVIDEDLDEARRPRDTLRALGGSCELDLRKAATVACSPSLSSRCRLAWAVPIRL